MGYFPVTSLSDRDNSNTIHLTGDPSLTSTPDLLSLRCKVAFLIYHHYFAHCSDKLAACIPPPMAQPCSTRQASFAHNYCVELSNARINWFTDGFFPSTFLPWQSHPASVFLSSSNSFSFRRHVYHHLIGQMARVFVFLFFLYRYYYALAFSYFSDESLTQKKKNNKNRCLSKQSKFGCI